MKGSHKDENVGRQCEGCQGMDKKKQAKQTDDGRKEERNRKRKKK